MVPASRSVDGPSHRYHRSRGAARRRSFDEAIMKAQDAKKTEKKKPAKTMKEKKEAKKVKKAEKTRG